MCDESLLRLIAYHRRRYWLGNGWSLWLRVWAVPPSDGKPQGIKYSFSLHDVDGALILAFDNAHGIARRTTHDHQHEFRNMDRRVPYDFTDGDVLIADFISFVRRACVTEGVEFHIEHEDLIGESEERGDDEANAG